MTAAACAAVLFFLFLPPAPLRIEVATGQPDALRGAYHIHTSRSDGALSRDDVARAAAAAGLQFAIFTDHGDGTGAAEPPAYLHGVLCVDAVEISTNDGHYIALGLPQAPYRLGGDGHAVVEDVRRLGGFGVAAHPFSPKPELAWRDWNVPLDGLEWLNGDSEWRDDGWGELARALAGYLVRPAPSLATLYDRPVSALAKWDQLTNGRAVIALAGHDAHGGFGEDGAGSRGRRLHVPSYETSFRGFSLLVQLDQAPRGDPEVDAELLLDAIRRGAVTTVVDALAGPAVVAFDARTASARATTGGRLPAGPATFEARASVPAGAVTMLLRNGQVVAESGGGALRWSGSVPGAYRLEIHFPNGPGAPPVPWVVTNPIYLGLPPEPRLDPPTEADGESAVAPNAIRWHSEQSAGSAASRSTVDSAQVLEFRLAPAPATSPFAALVADLPSGSGNFGAIRFVGRANRPMRVSAQLRFGRHGGTRWRRSFYVDQDGGEVAIRVSDLRPADAAHAMPPAADATSLLFVVDTTNAREGASGRLEIRELALIR